MSSRFVTTLVPALLLGAMALATPAGAQGRYNSDYDHYRQDRREAQQHRSDDRHESLGHALSDLFRYGTTDRYSSPEHYFRDQRRDDEHYLRDQDRAWDHDRRDRWYGYQNYDSYRGGGYYPDGGYNRGGDYYPGSDYYRGGDSYRDDDYNYSRDGRDRRR